MDNEFSNKINKFDCQKNVGIYMKIISISAFIVGKISLKTLYYNSNFSPFFCLYFRGVFLFMFNYILAYFMGLNVLEIPELTYFDLIFRSVFGCLANFCSFVSNKILPVSIVTAIGYTSPVFVWLFGIFLLKETISKIEILFLLVSLFGSILIVLTSLLETGLSGNWYFYLLPFGGAICGALAVNFMRKVNQKAHYVIPPTYLGLCIGTSFGSLMIWNETSDLPEIKPIAIILLSSVCFFTFICQIFLSNSLKHEKAGRLAIIGYFEIVVYLVFDCFIFKEKISGLQFVGIIFIMIPNVFVTIMKGMGIIN